MVRAHDLYQYKKYFHLRRELQIYFRLNIKISIVIMYTIINEKLKEWYYQYNIVLGRKQYFINIVEKSLNASTKEILNF